MEMKMNNIGDVISVLRKEAGLTQEELGKRSKLSRIIIVKIENNQRAISLEEAINISKALQVDVDKMYSYIDNPEENQYKENFAIAFKAKGMSSDNLKEIRRIELLVESLFAQQEIRGE